MRCMTMIALLALAMCQVGFAQGVTGRVVSLDYCADQFVLKLLPRGSILAVSPDAGSHFSYMRDVAEGLRRVRPVAEDVLILAPGLVVRSYGGGPRVVGFLEKAGIEVLQVPVVNDMDSIREALLRIAEGLGVPGRGREIAAEMDRRLSRIRPSAGTRTALYMTPTGVTSGPGTLVHEMLRAAGYSNFEGQPGWRAIPLERLAYDTPDVVAAAFFNAGAHRPAMWSSMRHPVAKRQMSERPSVLLQGAWTSCGSWFLLDAVEALASAKMAEE